MSDRDILEKAVKEAINNGWDGKIRYNAKALDDLSEVVGHYNFRGMHLTDSEDEDVSVEEVIYNHGFAKALWGDPWAWFTEGTSGDTLPSGNYINWKGHLANMIVSDDPIKYLEQNIL